MLTCDPNAPSEQNYHGSRTSQKEAKSSDDASWAAVPGQMQSNRWCRDAVRDQEYLRQWMPGLLDVRITDILLTVFTGLLVVIGFRQVDVYMSQRLIMEQQTELMRAQYVFTHRPRLRVRNLVIHPPRKFHGFLFHGHIISGQCYVSNIGGSAAKIIESHVMLFANQMGLVMERPYEGKDANNPIGGVIQAGSSAPLLINEPTPLATEAEADRVSRGAHPFFVMGWIAYADEMDVVRRTAFCRRWDAGKRRFVAVPDNPDYEHEE